MEASDNDLYELTTTFDSYIPGNRIHTKGAILPKAEWQEIVGKEYFYQMAKDGKFLINKSTPMELKHAKECARIAAEEIIKVCPYISKETCDTLEQLRASDNQFVSYWKEVLTEIG